MFKTIDGNPYPDCTCLTEDHESHTCPFQVEINGDRESECECCDACTGRCAWEV